MSDELNRTDAAQVQVDAVKIADWLVDNRHEFESTGLNEQVVIDFAEAQGIKHIKDSIQYLVERDDIERWPQTLASPIRDVLRPGRKWPMTRDVLLGMRPYGGIRQD